MVGTGVVLLLRGFAPGQVPLVWEVRRSWRNVTHGQWDSEAAPDRSIEKAATGGTSTQEALAVAETTLATDLWPAKIAAGFSGSADFRAVY
ncbi:hypothetical protein AS189_12335 [Arthrobacter alpinus]|uniref:Uncharacterized protein n=1 Tax=Arthrobacter alpinus TaxID=656366 RepID=A0A0S2M124_9MICC|nr:hypothetical protein AS189_12335 [Arthrobacter alpinus]